LNKHESRKMLRTIIALITLTIVPYRVVAEQPSPDAYHLTAAAAACLLQNERQYRSGNEPVVFIYTEICPRTQPTAEELSRTARNTTSIVEGPTRTIALSREELNCFFRLLRNARARHPTAQAYDINTSGC
jgi:hypothetical protein